MKSIKQCLSISLTSPPLTLINNSGLLTSDKDSRTVLLVKNMNIITLKVTYAFM